MSQPQPEEPKSPRKFQPFRWFITRAILTALAVWLFFLTYSAEAVRWPIRILILGLGIWATVALVREILWLCKVGGRHLDSLWNTTWRMLDRKPGIRVWRGWELAWSLALIVAAGCHLALVYQTMATVSLREDEVGSINQYASQGPFEVVTEYRLAKNHIFYNLVNSVTPYSGSFHPLRGRIWSFIAVTGWFAAVLVWFWRRGRYIEGAAIFALGALNVDMLETLLESRGYGFIGAFGGVSALFAINYLKSREQYWLVLISLLTVLGTWTLPFYIVFGGALHLGLWLVRRDRATLLSGVFSGLGVVLVYAPVMGGVLKVTEEYDDKYGFRYFDFDAVENTLHYLFPNNFYRLDFLGFMVLMAFLFLIPVLARRAARPEARGGALTLGAVLSFMIFCLVLETPPMRVTAFLALPLAAVVGLWLGMPFWSPRERPWRLLLAPAIAVLGITASYQLVRDYEYLPRQMWRDGAQAIDRLLPPEAKVRVNGHYSEMVGCLLQGGAGRLVRNDAETVEPINVGAVRRGRWILFDALFKHADQTGRIARSEVLPETRYFTLPLRVNYHRIWFALPDSSPASRGVADLKVNGTPQTLALPVEQTFDPLLLSRSAGPGDSLYVQDDYQPDGHPTPEAAAALAEWKAGRLSGPAPVVGAAQPMDIAFAVPLRDTDLTEKGRLTENAQFVGLLLSQDAREKPVTALWRDLAGNEHPLGGGKIRRLGELVMVELPKKALQEQEIAEVQVTVLPEPPITTPELRFLAAVVDPQMNNSGEDVLTILPRPPLQVLEIWRGAGHLPARD